MKPISIPDLSERPFNLMVERTMEASPEMLFRAWTKIRTMVCGTGECGDARGNQHSFFL